MTVGFVIGRELYKSANWFSTIDSVPDTSWCVVKMFPERKKKKTRYPLPISGIRPSALVHSRLLLTADMSSPTVESTSAFSAIEWDEVRFEYCQDCVKSYSWKLGPIIRFGVRLIVDSPGLLTAERSLWRFEAEEVRGSHFQMNSDAREIEFQGKMRKTIGTRGTKAFVFSYPGENIRFPAWIYFAWFVWQITVRISQVLIYCQDFWSMHHLLLCFPLFCEKGPIFFVRKREQEVIK